MKLPAETLSTVGAALNGYLALDPQLPPRVAELAGRVIELEIVGLDLRLLLLPQADGQLQLAQGDEPAPECTLSGTPLDLLRSGDPGTGRRLLFAGNVRITGDTELGGRIGEILGGVDIDWEEQLSNIVGDVAAHYMGRLAREVGQYTSGSGQTLKTNLAEYLTEEARLLPTRYESDEFKRELEQLRDDTERLQKRVERLSRAGNDDEASS